MRGLILVILLVLGSSAAQAENGLFYVGAGITKSWLNNLTDFGSGRLAPDLDNTSWKAFFGVQPVRWLAVEADYYDLGSGSGGDVITRTHADAKALSVFAVGLLRIPESVIDLYGKLGVARSKLNGEFTYLEQGTTSGVSSSGTGFAWGVGAQAHFKMVGVRLEYEGFSVPNSSGATVASLSVFLSF
jgi:hypothetical protein